ncbi:TonB-dependent receptor plug domain-containing protein [Nitrogeniibacter aestuarii]|uniref:TonB-dependent receptor plug domain-containing protein n=1 Tax=Nitrogeniibacter aestuarii TaxID=2815343 RepID=UPI001E374A8D|nr:TonB-dependent receptor [Nitrogeniibacter aestuarii]
MKICRHPTRVNRMARLVCTLLPAVSAGLLVASPASAAGKLTRMSLEDLMGMTVVGASKYEQLQSEVAAAVSVISREEIHAYGWRTLGDALASLPGLYLSYDRQYMGLGTRGFSIPGDFNTRILVTINGNRINDPLYDAGPTGREFPLDMDLVERIEFIPGPGGAVYGQNAMFGVVNVVTRTGASFGGAEVMAAYTHPEQRREARASWGQKYDSGVDVVASVSSMKARGDDLWMDFGSAGGRSRVRGLDGERVDQFFLRASQEAWSAEYLISDRKKDDPTAGYLSDPLTEGQYQKDRYHLLQIRYDANVPDSSLRVSARAFAGELSYASEFSYGGDIYGYPGKAMWHGFELQLVSTAVERHKLMVGMEYQRNSRVDQFILDASAPENNMRIESPGQRIGAYLQDEWRLADAVSATLGLRIDNNSVTGTKLSPRAGVIWTASGATVVKLLYGRAHRAPNAYESEYDDAVSVVANPDLNGETITTYEVVADHRLSSDSSLRAALYQWTIKDVIALGIDASSGLPQYQSGGDYDARGIELSFNRGWQSGASLRGSIAFQHASADDANRIANSPRMLGRLNASTPLPVLGAQLGYELRYDARREAVMGGNTGGYAISNLCLSTDAIARNTTVALDIRNLFDRHYRNPAPDTNWQHTIEQDGRSVTLGITAGF